MAATADPDPGRPVAMPAIPLVNPVKAPSARRWSLSAWLLVRDGDRAALAAGGLLGGSQAGARLTYRLNEDAGRPLSLSLRLYAPLDQPEAAEIALGAEWQPLRDLPLRLLAERRQAIGRDGRSAFSALVHGGVSEAPVAGPIRLDAYGQAGIVGLRSGDLFADGSVQLSLPLDGRDRVRAGAGAWGAIQPGAARLDLGPQLTFRLPARAANARLAAGWRFRVAGDAEPASGPALSVSTAF